MQTVVVLKNTIDNIKVYGCCIYTLRLGGRGSLGLLGRCSLLGGLGLDLLDTNWLGDFGLLGSRRLGLLGRSRLLGCLGFLGSRRLGLLDCLGLGGIRRLLGSLGLGNLRNLRSDLGTQKRQTAMKDVLGQKECGGQSIACTRMDG